jgi:hypothetical protein
MVRTTKRRGKRILVLDLSYTKPDGSAGRYRRDAEVQTRAGALAEERRRLAALAAKGSPFALVDATAAQVEAEQVPAPLAGPTLAGVVDDFCKVYAASRFKAGTRITYRNLSTSTSCRAWDRPRSAPSMREPFARSTLRW